MGRTLVVKGIIVGDYKYEEQNIENLILEEGLSYFGTYAFSRNNIKKLYLPKSVKRICTRSFEGNPIKELVIHNTDIDIEDYNFSEVEKITIIDGDYDSVVNLIIKCDNCNFGNVKIINIVNSELSFREKIKIKFLIRHYNNLFVNYLKEFDLEEFLKPDSNKFTDNDDKEIEDLLDKIRKIIESLDFETKKLIEDKVNLLLKEYQKNILSLKPKYELNNSNVNLTVGDKSFDTMRINLIVSLTIIIQNLNKQERLLEFLKKLNYYQEFIERQLKEDKQDDEILKKIKTIIEFSNSIKENKFKEKLKTLIEKTKQLISNNFHEEDIILTLKDDDIENDFKENLNKIYEKMLSIYSIVYPYFGLLNSIEEKSDSELSNELKKIDTIFSSLPTLDKLKNDYQQIKEKYIKIINDIILKLKKNEETIKTKDIELNFRKELQIILEKLNKKIPIILNNQILISQITLAIKSLEEETNENNWIIEFINEIRQTLKNDLIDYDIKEKVLFKLKSILLKWLAKLSVDDLSEIVKKFDNEIGLENENLIIEIMLLKELYEVKFSLDEYIDKLTNYKKVKTKAFNLYFGQIN